MSNLNNILNERNVPELLQFTNGDKVTADRWEERRREILNVLRDNEYGHAPEGPFTVTSEILEFSNREYANKAEGSTVRINVASDEGSFSFTIDQYIPKSDKKVPAIIFLNFRPDKPDRYWPIEETLDRGYATFRIYYNDISPDKKDEWTGLAEAFDRKKYDWGKIYMWAWAASRVLDYVETLDTIDLDNVAVLGHSRLGKTALWAAANDTRFTYAFVNDSGCSGDAITRGKTGEHVDKICENFPHWFCPKYREYAGREDEMPFEQHWLVAACAPRYVVSGTAIEDTWADPFSQFLSDYAASPAYELLGLDGLVTPDEMPKEGTVLLEGSVGYFLRSGAHFLSRYDWNRYMDFMDSKMKK